MTDSVQIRDLQGFEDYEACAQLQQRTWGPDFRECVPPAILKISQRVGGVVAGAFDGTGAMVGFVFGITGWLDDRPCHWSHMLAVRPDLRDHDLGRRLKEYQRLQLLGTGVTRMLWTYDPLVARNARVNLMKLGADISEYVPDMYGSNETSSVDSVIGTDRFVVRWDLDAPTDRPSTDSRPPALAGAPLANALDADGTPLPQVDALPEAPGVHLAIPADIQVLKDAEPDLARAWRGHTRRAFQWYLGRGYRIRDFVGTKDSPHHFYRLDAPRPEPRQP